MGEKGALTRLRRECSHIQSEKIPHVVARPTEKNMLIWYYVLHDLPLESPYAGGVYWGKLVFPKEYPLKPPAIYMMTPSGRFDTNTRLCLSMSDFHPESWNPSWRIESILIGLVSFMLDTKEPRTTGGMRVSTSKRRAYAKKSFDYNRTHTEFEENFPEFCDESKYHAVCGFFLEGPPDNLPASFEDTRTAAPVQPRRLPNFPWNANIPGGLAGVSVIVVLILSAFFASGEPL